MSPADSLWSALSEELETLKSDELYRRLLPAKPPLEDSFQPEPVDFSSNDYLGLSQNERVRQAASHAALAYGAGSGASRLISGNLPIHEALEARLASFKGEEAALVFSSGFLANLGAITALVGEKDAVVLDRLNHASLVDAARLSKAKLLVYPHLDPAGLEKVLAAAGRYRRVLVVTDAYFSMDGHLAPLDKLLKVCESFGAILMIDEAHSTGVFGPRGGGLTEQFGLKGKIPVVMGTLSKALGSVGGYVAGRHLLKETLVNRARSFIYTTAPAPAASAAALEALEILGNDAELLKKLHENTKRVREGLLGQGFDLMGSEGPIIPVKLGSRRKTLRAKELLAQKRIYAPAIRPPTVPKDTDRIRLSVRATHRSEEIQMLLDAFRAIKDSGG